MGQPAARVGDMHVCPMVTVLVPHVGGPILPPGTVTVLIGSMPAATATNMCVCVGPPDVIALGSTGVLIGGLPAARMGDLTAHGGTIVLGLPTVLIGEVSPSGGGAAPSAGSGGSGGAIGAAIQAVEEAIATYTKPLGADALAMKKNMDALAKAAINGDDLAENTSKDDITAQFTLVDEASKGVADVPYEIQTPDEQTHSGKTDSSGKTASLSGYSVSECNITYFKK